MGIGELLHQVLERGKDVTRVLCEGIRELTGAWLTCLLAAESLDEHVNFWCSMEWWHQAWGTMVSDDMGFQTS
jgi:hypothetical protein